MTDTERVPSVDPQSATGELARFYQAALQLSGRMPNGARVWAHSPYLGKFQLPASIAMQREGAGGLLSCRIKQMAVLKTSHLNSCSF